MTVFLKTGLAAHCKIIYLNYLRGLLEQTMLTQIKLLLKEHGLPELTMLTQIKLLLKEHGLPEQTMWTQIKLLLKGQFDMSYNMFAIPSSSKKHLVTNRLVQILGQD